MEDESARADRCPSLRHTRDAPDQSQCHGPSRRNPLGKINSEETSCIGTLRSLWQPHQTNIVLLHLSSISVIFSVSRSSLFLKSVTALLSSRASAWTESTRSHVCFAVVTMASNSSVSSVRLVGRLHVLTQFAQCWNQHRVHRISYCQNHNRIQSACRSLSAILTPLAIASSRFSLEMVESLNFFFIGDWSISLFRSPLSAEALMMCSMQSGLNFTDRIVKYVAKWAERNTKPASPSKGHVIPLNASFWAHPHLIKLFLCILEYLGKLFCICIFYTLYILA